MIKKIFRFGFVFPFYLLAEPLVDQSPSGLRITFEHGISLQFALHGGVVLGLQGAEYHGVPFSSPDTVLFPLLAEEFREDRRMWPFLKLEKVVTEANAVEFHTRLLGSADERAFRGHFVFAGDLERAKASTLPPELEVQREKSAQAQEKFEALFAEYPPMKEYFSRKKELEGKSKLSGKEAKQLRHMNSKKRARKFRQKTQASFLKDSPEAAALLAESERFEEELGPYSLENFGIIHRDVYDFAHFKMPVDVSKLSYRKHLLERVDWKEEGTLVWRVESATHTIGGWPWRGFKTSYRFELPSGRKVNAIRQLGTWEVDGDAVGVTAIALRYRGLGRIEQSFSQGPEGGIHEAWSTGEVIPGAVSGIPMVSPVVPPSVEVNDRGYALLHRTGSWICRMARGAGANFVDFQFRPHAGLISFHERQGNLRALSEAFPGDQVLSYTDEQIFPLSGSYSSEPQVFLMLADRENPFRKQDWQTRWHEVDQYVRDLVSKELGYQQVEPVPGIGILYETGRPGAFRWLGKEGASTLKQQGVHILVNHAPGWYSGQHKNGWDQPRTAGGNSNQIWDWHPTKDVEEPWQEMSRALAKEGIAYYAYMTGMVAKERAFYNEVGADLKYWGVNKPGNDFSNGYPPTLMGHNPVNERFRSLFVPKIEAAQENFGFQGIWADSFQNMYMSQLTWGDGTGTSTQRAWWEIIASWSRRGIHWMSESHGFPGWSCSIEVTDWEKDVLYFPYVWKWLRGNAQTAYSGEQLDELTFRTMAVKGWIGPDRTYKLGEAVPTPSFKRLSDEYMAALPSMRRPYILENQSAVLWLPYNRKDEGVLFVNTPLELPKGVGAAGILTEEAVGEALTPLHTYRVKAGNLLEAFDVREAPEADSRESYTYQPNDWMWFRK